METKYDGPNSESENDLPIFRTAEVYLNYAEAKAELGTLTQSDLDRTIGQIRACGNAPLDMVDANADPDPYLLDPKLVIHMFKVRIRELFWKSEEKEPLSLLWKVSAMTI